MTVIAKTVAGEIRIKLENVKWHCYENKNSNEKIRRSSALPLVSSSGKAHLTLIKKKIKFSSFN
jgi:hypothetical protein